MQDNPEYGERGDLHAGIYSLQVQVCSSHVTALDAHVVSVKTKDSDGLSTPSKVTEPLSMGRAPAPADSRLFFPLPVLPLSLPLRGMKAEGYAWLHVCALRHRYIYSHSCMCKSGVHREIHAHVCTCTENTQRCLYTFTYE